MCTYARDKRKSVRALFRLWYSLKRTARDTDYADCLLEIQEDVLIVSPKAYESGVITSLDLRLVDLYGDDVMMRHEEVPAPAEHELVC